MAGNTPDVMSPTTPRPNANQPRLVTDRGPGVSRNKASPQSTEPVSDTWNPTTMFSRPEPKKSKARAVAIQPLTPRRRMTMRRRTAVPTWASATGTW
jgi:hypothetical protein